MGRRLFWVAVGVGLTAFAIHKARQARESLSPQAWASTLGRQASTFAERVDEFWTTATTAAAAREAELRAELGLPEGNR